jgi:hypothetical protein
LGIIGSCFHLSIDICAGEKIEADDRFCQGSDRLRICGHEDFGLCRSEPGCLVIRAHVLGREIVAQKDCIYRDRKRNSEEIGSYQ